MHPRPLSRILLTALLAGCAAQRAQRPELRAALVEAQVTLTQSIEVAQAEAATSWPFQAALVLDAEPLFAVGTVQETTTLEEIRVSGKSGVVLSTTPLSGAAPNLCPDAISLTEALAIAEAEADGEAIAVVPDDDVECAFEIQVLSGETLWEVKVAPDGDVLEHELSDEYSGAEDDD